MHACVLISHSQILFSYRGIIPCSISTLHSPYTANNNTPVQKRVVIPRLYVCIYACVYA